MFLHPFDRICLAKLLCLPVYDILNLFLCSPFPCVSSLSCFVHALGKLQRLYGFSCVAFSVSLSCLLNYKRSKTFHWNRNCGNKNALRARFCNTRATRLGKGTVDACMTQHPLLLRWSNISSSRRYANFCIVKLFA